MFSAVALLRWVSVLRGTINIASIESVDTHHVLSHPVSMSLLSLLSGQCNCKRSQQIGSS